MMAHKPVHCELPSYESLHSPRILELEYSLGLVQAQFQQLQGRCRLLEKDLCKKQDQITTLTKQILRSKTSTDPNQKLRKNLIMLEKQTICRLGDKIQRLRTSTRLQVKKISVADTESSIEYMDQTQKLGHSALNDKLWVFEELFLKHLDSEELKLPLLELYRNISSHLSLDDLTKTLEALMGQLGQYLLRQRNMKSLVEEFVAGCSEVLSEDQSD